MLRTAFFTVSLSMLGSAFAYATDGVKQPDNVAVPDVNWVKTEVKQIFENKVTGNGENIAELLSIDLNNLTASSLVVASGHFTDKTARQILITVPGTAKGESDLGWETNLWLLVQVDSNKTYKTISSIRGDVAYQNSVMDMDGDSFDEISMVNRTLSNGVQRIAYKLFSFKTNSLMYVSQTEDRWTLNKENMRKSLVKGDLLYNVLENQYVDIDNDGKLEIVEKWIEFRYNGGKRINEIEQKKTMKIRSRILTLKDGVYQ